jgi:hypothetical protein
MRYSVSRRNIGQMLERRFRIGNEKQPSQARRVDSRSLQDAQRLVDQVSTSLSVHGRHFKATSASVAVSAHNGKVGHTSTGGVSSNCYSEVLA